MCLGIQQYVDVFAWILIENHKAGAGTQGHLAEQETAVRVYGDIARLYDQLILCDDR